MCADHGSPKYNPKNVARHNLCTIPLLTATWDLSAIFNTAFFLDSSLVSILLLAVPPVSMPMVSLLAMSLLSTSTWTSFLFCCRQKQRAVKIGSTLRPLRRLWWWRPIDTRPTRIKALSNGRLFRPCRSLELVTNGSRRGRLCALFLWRWWLHRREKHGGTSRRSVKAKDVEETSGSNTVPLILDNVYWDT